MSRRVFEQTENNNPDVTKRIAFGKAGAVTENMTWTNLFAYLLTKLAFLKTSQNLNDLPNKTTARANLGVYSTAQVDAADATKAAIYPAVGGALKTNNTTSFTPDADYEPATKKYVDDNKNDLLYKGNAYIGDIPGDINELTISFPSIGTANYIVLGDMIDAGNEPNHGVGVWNTKSHTSTSFILRYADYNGGVQDLTFWYRLYPK